MGKNSVFSIAGIILLDNWSGSTLSLMGIISLCTVLTWVIFEFHSSYSSLWSLLQTSLHFLHGTCKGRAEGKKNRAVFSTLSEPCSDHDRCINADDNTKLLCRGEVELIMDKLGIFYDPNGDELKERLGWDDMAALFEDRELSSEEVSAAFDVFDENCDGFIDASELEKVLGTLGFREASGGECQRMIEAFDENRDGRIDFSEFVQLLKKSSW